MGKGGSKNTTQTVVQEIPPFLQSQLQQVFGMAQGINPLVYSGDRVAGFTPLEQQAMLLTAQRAMAGDPTVQAAQGLLNKTVQGDFLDNPFLQDQINNAISGAVNQTTSQYARGGRLGSTAFGSALGAGVTGAAAPILAQAYDAERGRQMQAASLAPTLAQQSYIDLAALQGIGEQQRLMSQAEIQAQQDYINELNAAQQTQLAGLLAAAGLTPSTPNQTTSGTAPGVSPLAGAAGGALTGAALGSQIGAIGGPMGALIGGGLGALGILLETINGLQQSKSCSVSWSCEVLA